MKREAQSMSKREEDMVCPCTFEFEGARYKHDCDRCVYIGGVTQPSDGDNFGSEDRYYDIFLHVAGSKWPTLLARYSNDGPNYLSQGIYTTDGELVEDFMERHCEAWLEDYPITIAWRQYKPQIMEAING
jgi:hypothetical protein